MIAAVERKRVVAVSWGRVGPKFGFVTDSRAISDS